MADASIAAEQPRGGSGLIAAIPAFVREANAAKREEQALASGNTEQRILGVLLRIERLLARWDTQGVPGQRVSE